ncbi:transmembrane protein 154 isoform X2 [Nerophis ophidion]|uniref:transmembrane protein 154 isoform X2 n=1 Tax=Nerophis ophidion TaxID=159077 RepID=UPI002AE04BE2|nr:transmembrane protein 154 isoform X2 [Nerophis ophidion]
MSASWPSTMRGPRGPTPSPQVSLLLLLWLLTGTWTGTVSCQDEPEDFEQVVEGEVDVLEPTLSPPESPPTLETSPTQEDGSDSETIRDDNTSFPDSTLSPLGDEGLSLSVVIIPVALALLIIAVIVFGLFIIRRFRREPANPDSRKDDPYLDGSSMDKVPMPMFEEDVPSVLELEMEELDQWMKKDGIYWSNTISNANLWDFTRQATQIRRRKWNWIGHKLLGHNRSIRKHALTWNPQGKRKRGRQRATWRKTTEQEMKAQGLSWQQLERRAQDRRGWRNFINGLCSLGNLKA